MVGSVRSAAESALARAARAAGRPVAAARIVALEGLSLAAHAVIYPVGAAGAALLGDDPRERRVLRLDDRSPLERGFLVTGLAATSLPVVLVHGIGDNRSAFPVLRRGLNRRGFDRVVTFEYSPLTSDLRVAAGALGTFVEDLLDETGEHQVQVIGHSLGGLVARYYVQRLAGDRNVAALVTLATPHGGTRTATFLPSGLGRQLRPGSELVRELAAPAPGCRTRFVAVHSAFDQVVRPADSAMISHPDLDAENIEISAVGHWSMPMDRRVISTVAGSLLVQRLPPPNPAPATRGNRDTDPDV